MANAFVGARLKLDRARDQVKGLEAAFATFIAEGPFYLGFDGDLQTRKVDVWVHVHKLCEPTWSVIVG